MKITYLGSQTTRNKWMFPQTAISYVKDFNCHIGTTICFWLFGFPGRQVQTGHEKKMFLSSDPSNPWNASSSSCVSTPPRRGGLFTERRGAEGALGPKQPEISGRAVGGNRSGPKHGTPRNQGRKSRHWEFNRLGGHWSGHGRKRLAKGSVFGRRSGSCSELDLAESNSMPSNRRHTPLGLPNVPETCRLPITPGGLLNDLKCFTRHLGDCGNFWSSANRIDIGKLVKRLPSIGDSPVSVEGGGHRWVSTVGHARTPRPAHGSCCTSTVTAEVATARR